jgi:hypothetical protein
MVGWNGGTGYVEMSQLETATAVSLQPTGVEIRKRIRRASIVIVPERALESVSKGEINEPRDGQDN